MPKPTAFLCYAPVDDEDGRISEVRGQLDTAYWAYADSSSKASIFQDVIQTVWEPDWRTRLSQAIEEPIFLVPIVTPAFFAHQPCKDALRAFAARELTLGHKDLILPIYYSDVPDFEISADPLVRLVASRNVLDWRELNATGFRGDAETEAVKQLVLALRDATAAQQTVSRPKATDPQGSVETPTGLKPFLSRPPRPAGPDSTPPPSAISRPPPDPFARVPSQPPRPVTHSMPPAPATPPPEVPPMTDHAPPKPPTPNSYLYALGGLAILAAILGTALVMTFALKPGPTVAKTEPPDAGPSIAAAPAPAQKVVLRFAGSDTIGDHLAGALAQGFLKEQLGCTAATIATDPENPHLIRVIGSHGANEASSVIEITSHHSSDAITGLQSDADIGMMSRAMTEKEREEFRQRSVSVTEHILGLDGIAVVMNPNIRLTGAGSNPGGALTVEQLRGIFAGTIKRWSELGGPNVDIVPFIRGIGSGTREIFETKIMKGTEFSSTAKVVDRNGMVSGILQAEGGVGFVTWTDGAAAQVVAVSQTADGEALKPGFETIDREDYILTRRLYLYLRPHADAARALLATQFLTYALSDHGQDEVEKSHFVRLDRFEVKAASEDPREPSEYRQATRGAQRVSLNLQFVEGRAELDSRAERDVGRLVEFLHRDSSLARRSVLLIGLGGKSKDELAERRAQALASAFQQEGVSGVDVKRLASRVVTASADSSDGSRRVEVWLQ